MFNEPKHIFVHLSVNGTHSGVWLLVGQKSKSKRSPWMLETCVILNYGPKDNIGEIIDRLIDKKKNKKLLLAACVLVPPVYIMCFSTERISSFADIFLLTRLATDKTMDQNINVLLNGSAMKMLFFPPLHFIGALFCCKDNYIVLFSSKSQIIRTKLEPIK